MTTLTSARNLAGMAHAGQQDKSGAPYLGHLARVAVAVGADEDAQAVAWLHDLVEDRPAYTELLIEWMPTHIVRAVFNLTKSKGEPDELYFARIRVDPLTLKVKLADIADNMSEHRMGKLDEATQTRLRAKYARALSLLAQPT